MDVPAQLSSVRPDGKRFAIHPLEVRGRFITARRVTFAVLIAIYVLAPLITIGGHPALHLDIETRRFYLLGHTFNAQDTWLLALLGFSFVFSLLFLTAWRGRLWCGWACPQTVFLEGVFRPIERFFDGPSTRRNKAASQPWTASRVLRTAGKHATYLAVAIALAHVATAVIVSARELEAMIVEGPSSHLVAFAWTTAFTAVLYFDFAWFREQFCVVLCPYGRLQSVLHDCQSVTVAYDVKRGEPRGKVSAAVRGDCIDCKKCVMACPTAIDIRNGLQMECLGCAQCIDACDEVMLKIDKPRGLIRYASMAEVDGEKRRVLRPRLFVYLALATLSASALGAALVSRVPFEANVGRLRGVPFVVEGDRVRNQFNVHVVNKQPDAAQYRLVVHGPAALAVELGYDNLTLASLEGAQVPMVLTLPRDSVHGTLKLDLEVQDNSGNIRHIEVPFVAPR